MAINRNILNIQNCVYRWYTSQGMWGEFKEVRNYRTPKLGGYQEPNADGQFTRPFRAGAYNL